MADKLRTLQNLEALQARYIGTGHADTTKYEWVSNILRDSYSSYIGHPPLLSYMAVGLGEPKEKVRAMMIDKMIRGAGNPPEVRLPVHCFCFEISLHAHSISASFSFFPPLFFGSLHLFY
jgi:splicing factor 3B subunit 5